MAILKQVDRIFWFFLLAGMAIGFLFPAPFMGLDGYVIYIVMAIMGLLFFKVNIFDVVDHVKKAPLIIYISCIHLLVIPSIAFFVFKFTPPNLHLALFLLGALPAGASSAAFTDMMSGRTSLNITIIILSNLFCIGSLPLLFWFYFDTTIVLDYLGLMLNLAKIIILPFVFAKSIKHLVKPRHLKPLQEYSNFIIILLLTSMIAICASYGSSFIIETYIETGNYAELLKTLGILYLAFFLFHIVGYFSVFWLKKGEKLAVSNSVMIMNTILGIVLSLAFFNLEVLTILILSLIPWNTMIIAKHWYRKFLP